MSEKKKRKHTPERSRRFERSSNTPRRSRQSTKTASDKGDRLIMGRNSIHSLLTHQPELAESCYVLGSGPKEVHDSKRLRQILDSVEESGLPVKALSREDLDNLCGSSSHQGIALRLKQRAYYSLDQVLLLSDEQSPQMVLCLDGIEDPQNFGAILRSALGFGCGAVVWSTNRGCSITPVVSKVAVGAAERVPLAPVSNLREALRKLKKAGFWVAATANSPEATNLTEFDFPKSLALVLGAEGKGVSEKIVQDADFLVRIPVSPELESLNVSQAAAICGYAWYNSLGTSANHE